MTITLTPAALFDQNSTFHFSEDNSRLTQLNANDAILATQINALSGGGNTSVTATGNWSSISIVIPFTTLSNSSAVGIVLKVWGIENTAVLSGQNSFIGEFVLAAYKDSSGNMNLVNSSPVYIKNIGATTVTMSFAASTNTLVGTVSGFSGSAGKILAKVEYFN